jgi:hypothetical protein
MVDYHLLSAMDMPRNFEVIHHDVASRHTPLGSKGKGQGAPGMVLAALANAIGRRAYSLRRQDYRAAAHGIHLAPAPKFEGGPTNARHRYKRGAFSGMICAWIDQISS